MPRSHTRRASPFTSVPVLILLATAVTAAGCGKGKDEAAAGDGADESAAAPSLLYPATLGPESAPEDVASVLVQALDDGDQATLLGLVAVAAESQAVSAIYERHGKTAEIKPQAVARMTAAGWQATYVFCQKGETEVVSASVEGDTAVVNATVKRPDGIPGRLRIMLTREDGVWKVCAGLKTVSD